MSNNQEIQSHSGSYTSSEWKRFDFVRLRAVKLALELDFELTYTSDFTHKDYKQKKFLWWTYNTSEIETTWYTLNYTFKGPRKIIYEAQLRIADIKSNVKKYMQTEQALEGALQA